MDYRMKGKKGEKHESYGKTMDLGKRYSGSNVVQEATPIAKEVFKCFHANMDNFTDFTVNIDDTKFNCHKFVLSSCSGFFEALMRTDMREKSESSCTIEGISPETFGLIIDVIYKGWEVLRKENMLELWHASSQLQIKFLIEACENFVKENITIQNYWDVYQNAKLLGSSMILSEARKTMVHNYFDIVWSDAFMELSLEDLLEIFQNDQLNVCADFAVISVLKWANIEDNSNSNLIGKQKSGHRLYPMWQSFGQNREKIAEAEEQKYLYRRSCLGQLFGVIRLDQASNECITGLMNNKSIMANIDAILIVNKLASMRLGRHWDQPKATKFKKHLGQPRDDEYSENRKYDDSKMFEPNPTMCKHCSARADEDY
ncbi:kelch repeat and BTB domain-containing protein 3-like [Physella acuta]|uniref:kelch repeat and BTB domain-containing protein 3-like n=1 Tax=Physella acuta TaxID=109671 RepID=UPI0027DBD90B|nr:kelch repeat and BTB domain-containing protein 3-like [Physella acuta]